MNIDIHAKSPEEYKVVELKPVDGASHILLANRSDMDADKSHRLHTYAKGIFSTSNYV
jgi:hypothetical protein